MENGLYAVNYEKGFERLCLSGSGEKHKTHDGYVFRKGQSVIYGCHGCQEKKQELFVLN